MRIKRRFIVATAVITSMLQLAVTTVAMIGVCMERPHTHGGRAAPECAAHLQQSPPPVSGNPHAHHADASHETVPDTSRMTCRCSADPLSFLAGDIGVIPDRISARVPSPARSTIAAFTSDASDVRIPPFSPPPRPILS
jgi:hypothetical protein